MIHLGLGSNLGNREENLRRAIKDLQKYVRLHAVADLYETTPYGYSDQGNFFNTCLAVAYDGNSFQLLQVVEKIEQAMGRKREIKWGPRIIDIDILFYNDEIHKYPQLTLPHPEIQNRRFVLAPMAEIAPAFIHPVLKKTIAELLSNCPDKLAVKRYS